MTTTSILGKLTVVPLYTSNDSYSDIIHLHAHAPVIMKRAAKKFSEDTIICLNLFLSFKMVRIFLQQFKKKWLNRCKSLIQFYKHNTFRANFCFSGAFKIVKLEYVLLKNTTLKHTCIYIECMSLTMLTPSVHYVLQCLLKF